jgi:hypothetical protein
MNFERSQKEKEKNRQKRNNHHQTKTMPFLDRTNELTTIIENKIQQQIYEGKNKPKKKQAPSDSKQAAKQFYDKASSISQDLCHTAEVLQKLTKCKCINYY